VVCTPLFRTSVRTRGKQGLPFTDDLWDEYDILLVNSFMVPYATVLKVKRSRQHVRVVQRVDGAARDYGRTGGADAEQHGSTCWRT